MNGKFSIVRAVVFAVLGGLIGATVVELVMWVTAQ